jgi:hypothetical protein
MPSILASIFPKNKGFPSSFLLVFSGEKKERIIPTTKTISVNSIKTFGTS